jgi:hypothetical protein
MGGIDKNGARLFWGLSMKASSYLLKRLGKQIIETRRELFILERIGEKLASRIERGADGMDPLVRRHLDEIGACLAEALASVKSTSLPLTEDEARLGRSP